MKQFVQQNALVLPVIPLQFRIQNDQPLADKSGRMRRLSGRIEKFRPIANLDRPALEFSLQSGKRPRLYATLISRTLR